MIAALVSALPEIITRASTYLRDAVPVVLIVIGAILFLFAGAIKWLAKVIGAALIVYGLLTVLQFI